MRANNISDVGVKLLIENEGFKNKAYQDSYGFWTIGVGHLITPQDGAAMLTKVLRDDEVYDLLRKDIAHSVNWINANCHWDINQNQFDAMCSFLHQYNLDSHKYPNTRLAFTSGNIKEITRILEEDFNNADVSKKDGLLKKRRQRELALFKKECK